MSHGEGHRPSIVPGTVSRSEPEFRVGVTADGVTARARFRIGIGNPKVVTIRGRVVTPTWQSINLCSRYSPLYTPRIMSFCALVSTHDSMGPRWVQTGDHSTPIQTLK